MHYSRVRHPPVDARQTHFNTKTREKQDCQVWVSEHIALKWKTPVHYHTMDMCRVGCNGAICTPNYNQGLLSFYTQALRSRILLTSAVCVHTAWPVMHGKQFNHRACWDDAKHVAKVFSTQTMKLAGKHCCPMHSLSSLACLNHC